MSALEIGLDWQKDSKGYRINDYGKYGTTIVGNGGRLVPIRPLQNDMVFMAFAKIESQLELLEFVQHFGLLEKPSYDERYGSISVDATTLTPIKSRPVIYGEDVDDHLESAQMFRDLMALTRRKGRASSTLSGWIEHRMLDEKLGEMGLEFVSGRGFHMVLKADSLMNGMLMQLAQKISGQSKFQSCEFCGVTFEVGPGTKRRADATFCSPDHKIKFHSRRRSKKHR
jgi:hypothetical protein